MLQSPKSRIQPRQRRLTNTSENPILEAKQDPLRRIQRPLSPRPIAPSTGQRGAPRKQQHRRNQSVPGNILMSIASAPTAAGHADYNLYQTNTLNGRREMMGTGGERQKHANANSFFMQTQKLSQQRSQSPSIKSESKYEHRFFLPGQQADTTRMIDDILSFDGSPLHNQHIPRRGSEPQRGTNGEMQSQAFSRNALPASPHAGHFSTFDLAPLPHNSNYVNLATLTMPEGNSIDPYYRMPASALSPTFRPSPEIQQESFENTMATVVEEPMPDTQITIKAEHTMIKVPPLPENTTFNIPRERGETTPKPLGAKATGISMEEITSFISGPDPSDGKWVCQYPDCRKRFGRKENIKSHVQTHLGDRQYVCEACKKCFVRQHDLKRHAKIHTGIKPYPCLCGNSFARHDALTRHRQRGMCVGAFEGIVRKVAKRGRPRKKPLNEDGSEPAKIQKGTDQESSSFSSSSGSDVSDPRTPAGMDGLETLHYDEYDYSSSSSARSMKEESPDGSQEDYTPPTSPPEFCDFEFAPNRDSFSSVSLPDEDYKYIPRMDYSELGLPHPGGNQWASDSSSDGCDDQFLFSQDGMEMFGLSTLEQDPELLRLGDGFVKPELLSNS